MKKRYLDLLERVAWTTIQAFAAFLISSNLVLDETNWGATFAAAGIAAGIAAAKCLVAFQVGNPQSAALPETEPPI